MSELKLASLAFTQLAQHSACGWGMACFFRQSGRPGSGCQNQVFVHSLWLRAAWYLKGYGADDVAVSTVQIAPVVCTIDTLLDVSIMEPRQRTRKSDGCGG